MSYQSVLFERREGIARLTLNRPERLNSFNVQMHEEVRRALQEIEQDSSCRVLVLSGVWPEVNSAYQQSRPLAAPVTKGSPKHHGKESLKIAA